MKVNDYGDFISKVLGKKLICYVTFGSYQGEWVAVLENGENVELWKGYYGSCSGCDVLENWYYDVPEDRVNDYFKEDHAFLEIPKEQIKNMSIEDFKSIFPANIDIGNFDHDKMLSEIKKGLK